MVIVKGQRDGIDILLDASADFEQLQEILREKVAGAKKFFEGAKTNISFRGRDLSETEEMHLLDIILSETNLDIDFRPRKADAAPAPTPSEDTCPLGLAHTESETAYYRGGLRSGQSIKFRGSVVIMGDVNPGSEVVAGGNVVVLGSLKGMAHAGAKGDNSCFVSALVLQPTQLRIGTFITYVKPAKKDEKKPPSYAYVKDDQVFVAHL